MGAKRHEKEDEHCQQRGQEGGQGRSTPRTWMGHTNNKARRMNSVKKQEEGESCNKDLNKPTGAKEEVEPCQGRG